MLILKDNDENRDLLNLAKQGEIIKVSQRLWRYLLPDNAFVTETGPRNPDSALEEFERYLKFGQASTLFMERRFLQSLEELDPAYHLLATAEDLWGFFCYCRHCRIENEAGGGILGACLYSAFHHETYGDLFTHQKDELVRSLILYDLYQYGSGYLSISDSPVLFFYILAKVLCDLCEARPERRLILLKERMYLEKAQAERTESFCLEAGSAFSRLEILTKISPEGRMEVILPSES